MAELIITLRRVAEDANLVLRVGFRSDEDALPSEHEQRHRELLEQLLPCLASTGGSHSSLEVERERPAQEPVVG